MRTSVISRVVPAFVAAIMVSSAAAYAAPMGGMPMGGSGGGPGMTEHHATQAHMRGHDRHGGPGRQGALGRADHVEGRIAFLKAELKITDAQNTQWEAVAKAMRDQSATMNKLHEEHRAARDAARKEATENKDQALTAPEALARREQFAAAHAKAITVRMEGQKQFASAFAALYDGLSAEQKKVADNLFSRGGRAHFAQHRR